MTIKNKLFSFGLTFLMLSMFLSFTTLAAETDTPTGTLRQDADGYYQIGSVEELYLFTTYLDAQAQKDLDANNGKTSPRTPVNARLTADIDLNPGLTVSYDPDKKKVELSKNGKSYTMETGFKDTTAGQFRNADGEKSTLNAVKSALGLAQWMPIAPKATYDGETTYFTYIGHFDGNGHTIDGLFIYVNEDSPVKNTGLFAKTEPGSTTISIEDLTIGEHSLVVNTNTGTLTGAFVSGTYGDLIQNCVNKAVVVGVNEVGGIVGRAYGSIYSCKNYGSIISKYKAGGIAGVLYEYEIYDSANSVRDCENHGNIYNDYTYIYGSAGGIAGISGASNYKDTGGVPISQCINYGNVTGSCAGGIVDSFANTASINGCANFGSISASNQAGGIAANGVDSNWVKISSCYNVGKVSLMPLSSLKDVDTISNAQRTYGAILGACNFGKNCRVEKCYNNNDTCPVDNAHFIVTGVEIADSYNVSTEVFQSGEATYNMYVYNQNEWGQNLAIPAEEGKTPDTYPNYTSKRHVYKVTSYCCHTDTTNKEAHKTTLYTNAYSEAITSAHTPGTDEYCTHCGVYAAPPRLTTTVLRKAKAGTSYTMTFYLKVAADSPVYSFVKSETDDTLYTLPEGLSVNYSNDNSVTIGGTPTVPGTYTFTLKVTDTRGEDKKTYTLTVAPADPLTIITKKLSANIVGNGYYASLYTNLIGDAVWSLAEGSSLPEGLVLDTKSAAITGTLPEVAGDYSFTVCASLYGQTATQTLTLTVLPENGCAHTSTQKTAALAATCQKPGRITYWTCDDCGKRWSDESKEQELSSWNYPQNVTRYAEHTDTDKDGVCDSCHVALPVFRKVTEEKEIAFGSTYILVSKIGDKYYALTKPYQRSEYETDIGYESLMPLCEITPNADGSFTYATLMDTSVMMVKTNFCAMCEALDAGLPRYSLTTLLNGTRYSVNSDDYGSVFSTYPDENSKYGLRMSLDESGNVLIASVYCEYWKNEDDTATGLLRAYDTTVDGTQKQFMSLSPSYHYTDKTTKLEPEVYAIQLYKMTYPRTTGDKSYSASDVQSDVDLSLLEATLANMQGAALSGVGGLVEAIDPAYVNNSLFSIETTSTNLRAESYADIAVIEAVDDGSDYGLISLTYSLTPRIRVKDEDGTQIADFEVADTKLNGNSMTVTLYFGSLTPKQIIHYKEDGTEEYFYPENSTKVKEEGAKSFSIDSDYNTGACYVTFELTSFSNITILCDAEPEKEQKQYDVSIADIFLHLPKNYTSNDVYALGGNGYDRIIRIKNIGTDYLSMTTPYLTNLTPATDKIFVNWISIPSGLSSGNTSSNYYIDIEKGLAPGVYTTEVNFMDGNNKLEKPATAHVTVTVGDFCFQGVTQSANKAVAKTYVYKPGSYTLVFADYENGKLQALDFVPFTVNVGSEGLQTITSNKALTLGSTDTVMLLENLETLAPLCASYTVE